MSHHDNRPTALAEYRRVTPAPAGQPSRKSYPITRGQPAPVLETATGRWVLHRVRSTPSQLAGAQYGDNASAA